MIDFEEVYTTDYKGRDIKAALEEALQMVDIALTPPIMRGRLFPTTPYVELHIRRGWG